MTEIENELKIRCSAVTWPIGMGPDFKGVYHRYTKQVLLFEESNKGASEAVVQVADANDPALEGILGERLWQTLREEVELLDGAGDALDVEAFRAGLVTPVYFGSAMNNFGVEPFLRHFMDIAPKPGPRKTTTGFAGPEDKGFSAFVFKVQANMDKSHRDRIAFLRVCSGRYEGGMKVRHVRLGREMRLSRPQQFMAQERTIVEEAFPGDVLGVFDPGNLRIGDTLTQGQDFEFEGVPRFSPEFFARARLKDPMRRKQFITGLDQLVEEGTVQSFTLRGQEKDPVLGVVGRLQFEVFQYRMANEYGAEIDMDHLGFVAARWVVGEGADPETVERARYGVLVKDIDHNPVVLFKSEWEVAAAEREYPKWTFLHAAPLKHEREMAGAKA